MIHTKICSVTEITHAIRREFDNNFSDVKVEGEISNCRPSGSGHIYFSLKDSNALISAALFRGRASRISVKPADGMKVIVSGKIDVYPPRGSYQIIVENLEKSGRGDLLEALERRKEKLATEGLFNLEAKQALPFYPRRVAVITSPTGAAIRDILQVLARRSAAPLVRVLPTLVQGDQASEAIADQIRRAASYKLGDVIIIARGGGSLEDLMPFNEETVVRAIAECPIPVISGIGHEIDISLADLAADSRAATPSAAAELVSDRSEDLLLRARGFRQEASDILSGRVLVMRSRLERTGRRELKSLVSSKIDPALRRSDEIRHHLLSAAQARLESLRQRIKISRSIIREISPQAVLERGYAHVTQNGKTVFVSSDLSKGMNIKLRFASGEALADVSEVVELS